MQLQYAFQNWAAMKGRLDHLHIRQGVHLLVGFVVLLSSAAFSYGFFALVVKEVVMIFVLPHHILHHFHFHFHILLLLLLPRLAPLPLHHVATHKAFHHVAPITLPHVVPLP
jgi:hypothetical protein